MKEQGKTIILVEHKIDLIAEYCDHILLISGGEIGMIGETEEVLTDPTQVVLYFLERRKKTGEKGKIPLTVEQAYKILKKGGRN